MEEQRFYYKTQDEKGLLNLKHQLTQEEISEHNYIQITREEFEQLVNKQEEEEYSMAQEDKLQISNTSIGKGG